MAENTVLPGDLFDVQPEAIVNYVKHLPTPLHVYDEVGIRQTCRRLKKAFSWKLDYNNFFAVKATPNPHILNILKDEGFGMDCSSLGELLLCEACKIPGEKIMFTSNNTPIKEFKKAIELGAIINLDDYSHLMFLCETIELPEQLCFRYNPGPARTGNVIIGDPKEAKFGMTREQIFDAIEIAMSLGVTRFGLHTMVVSNCLEPEELIETARMMFKFVYDIHSALDVQISFVNLGGGLGVAYKPGEQQLNIEYVASEIKKLYDEMILCNGLTLKLFHENGRYILAPNGCLITKVIHQKKTYKNYIGVDACMADLMRPGMYKAYHHISVVPSDDAEGLPSRRSLFTSSTERENGSGSRVYDVVGGLCENNDKFAIDRSFNKDVLIGDYLVIHDTGAHGHAMGFNYNAKLRSAEYLLNASQKIVQIRRAECYGDLFSTLDFEGLPVVPSSLKPADKRREIFKFEFKRDCIFLMACAALAGFTYNYFRRKI